MSLVWKQNSFKPAAAQNLQEKWLYARGEVLAVAAWDVRTLMDVTIQVHILFKYRVDVA